MLNHRDRTEIFWVNIMFEILLAAFALSDATSLIRGIPGFFGDLDSSTILDERKDRDDAEEAVHFFNFFYIRLTVWLLLAITLSRTPVMLLVFFCGCTAHLLPYLGSFL